MKPCIVIVLDPLNNQTLWCGALDLHFMLYWLCQNFMLSLEIWCISLQYSWEFETLQRNCAWHTLWAHTMTRCSWLLFMLHWPCPNFTSRLEIKCISLCSSNGCEYETLHSGCLLDTLFKHTPWPFFCLTYIACCSYFTKCRCDIDLSGVLVRITVYMMYSAFILSD